MSHKKFKVFQDTHDQAMQDIEYFLEPSKYEPKFHELVLWLMQTEHNPYGYLLKQDAKHIHNSALDFANFLHCISHALYDDGDIAFVTVDDTPMIVFMDAYDEEFKSRLTAMLDKDSESWTRNPKGKYDIKVLDILPKDFGKLYDAYMFKQEQRNLKLDFKLYERKHGLEQAIEKFKDDKHFNLEYFTSSCWEYT